MHLTAAPTADAGRLHMQQCVDTLRGCLDAAGGVLYLCSSGKLRPRWALPLPTQILMPLLHFASGIFPFSYLPLQNVPEHSYQTTRDWWIGHGFWGGNDLTLAVCVSLSHSYHLLLNLYNRDFTNAFLSKISNICHIRNITADSQQLLTVFLVSLSPPCMTFYLPIVCK